jgi:hypothetical protein
MGLLTIDFFLSKLLSGHFWGDLSDERSGLSCVVSPDCLSILNSW